MSNTVNSILEFLEFIYLIFFILIYLFRKSKVKVNTLYTKKMKKKYK